MHGPGWRLWSCVTRACTLLELSYLVRRVARGTRKVVENPLPWQISDRKGCSEPIYRRKRGQHYT